MSKSRVAVVSVIATIAVLMIFGFAAQKFAKKKPNAAVVRLEEAAVGDLTEIVTAQGEVEPKKKVSISARVAARILELPFDEGQQVTCGDPCCNPVVPPSVLVRLDAKEYESQLRSASASKAAQAAQIDVQKTNVEVQQANLLRLSASIELAKSDCLRAKKLMDSNIVSTAEYEQSKCKLDELNAEFESTKRQILAATQNLSVLQHNLEAAEAQILKAADALSYCTITSPIKGTVTSVKAEAGELVVMGTMNNAGTVILEVADLSKMLFVSQIDESDVTKLKPGQRAKVRLQAFGPREFSGKVETVALVQTTSRETGTKYFRTEILMDDCNDRLLSGLTGDADIETRTHKGVIRVPSQCVLGRSVDDLPPEIRTLPEVDKNKTLTAVVFRAINGKAVITPVKIGPSDLTHTAITSGLKAGDKIIAGPYKILDTVKHNDVIQDEKEAKPADKNGDANKAK